MRYIELQTSIIPFKEKMSIIIVAVLVLLIGIFNYLFTMTQNRNRTNRRSPPGPWALPVIGHLHKLGELPHRALQAMSQKHGPIMSIRLGQVPTIVISSPEAAELILKAHDTVFASRPTVESSKYLNYNAKGIAFTPYGAYWRYVRKLCTHQLMNASRIESFAPLRRDEVRAMVERLKKKAQEKAVVDLTESVSKVVEEITFRMMFGYEIDSVDFKGVAMEGIHLAGTFNLADYVPFLGPLDLQGLTRKLKKVSIVIDELLEKIIHEVRKNSSEKKSLGVDIEKSMSFIEVLLSMIEKPLIPLDEQDQDQTIQLENVKSIIGDMLAASFDTAITAIEWTLSELLRNPEVMTRVQQELSNVVGVDRIVEEFDLPKLPYLDMVIMESFRLHPPGPLLVPRESLEDVEISGYFIPKKSRVLINVWAIGRDSSVWSEKVESFMPERFIDSDIGFQGNDFRFTPFGSGRRGCPERQLGLTTVRLVVAQLMHCFNWELPNGMLACDLDMSEKFGLTLPRAKHLLAVPTFCLYKM